MKNLGKKLITLILTVSMFFGTGITNVFAYTLQEQPIEPTIERTQENNYDLVGWASHVYSDLKNINNRIEEINIKANTGASYADIYRADVNIKGNNFNTIMNSLLDFSNPINATINLGNGNKLNFRDSINDPEIVIISLQDVEYTGQELYAFYEEGSNLLKNFHDTKIKEMEDYLKSVEDKIAVMDNLKNSENVISTSINELNLIIPDNYEYTLNHIDLTKIIYNEETQTVDLTAALDLIDENGLNIDWNSHEINKQNLQEVIKYLIRIKKNILIFEENKILYDANTYPSSSLFSFEVIKENYENSINELDKTSPVTNMIILRDKLKNKLIDTINNKIKSEYDEVNLKYTNDVDREITYNKLTEILETKGLSNLKYLFTIARINDEDIKEFIDTVYAEYDKSKLSVDNTLASLTINGIKLDVTKESQTLYLPYEVTTLNVETILNNLNSTISIIKPNELIVGENIVKIIVTAQNGNTKEYIVKVIRKAKEEKTAEVITLTNTYNNTNTNTEIDSKTDLTDVDVEIEKEKEKYEDNELEEEKLSGWTVLLIVAGIGLIGFGVYLLFGDKATPLIVKKETIKPRSNPIKPRTNPIKPRSNPIKTVEKKNTASKKTPNKKK